MEYDDNYLSNPSGVSGDIDREQDINELLYVLFLVITTNYYC